MEGCLLLEPSAAVHWPKWWGGGVGGGGHRGQLTANSIAVKTCKQTLGRQKLSAALAHVRAHVHARTGLPSVSAQRTKGSARES